MNADRSLWNFPSQATFSGQDPISPQICHRAPWGLWGQGWWELCDLGWLKFAGVTRVGHTWALAGGVGAALQPLWEGRAPLASSWTAAHARSWHFRLDPGLLPGPVPAPGQLGYLLFILGRAGSWQQGLKWCLPFIFRDGKMLAFWQPLFLWHTSGWRQKVQARDSKP